MEVVHSLLELRADRLDRGGVMGAVECDPFEQEIPSWSRHERRLEIPK